MIIIGKANQFRGEIRQRNQIGNGHKAVDGFRQQPHRSGAQSGGQKNGQRLQHGKGAMDPGTEQILGTSKAVKPPAQHRGKCETAQRRRNGHGHPGTAYGGKRLHGQPAPGIHAIGDGHAA